MLLLTCYTTMLSTFFCQPVWPQKITSSWDLKATHHSSTSFKRHLCRKEWPFGCIAVAEWLPCESVSGNIIFLRPCKTRHGLSGCCVMTDAKTFVSPPRTCAPERGAPSWPGCLSLSARMSSLRRQPAAEDETLAGAGGGQMWGCHA